MPRSCCCCLFPSCWDLESYKSFSPVFRPPNTLIVNSSTCCCWCSFQTQTIRGETRSILTVTGKCQEHSLSDRDSSTGPQSAALLDGGAGSPRPTLAGAPDKVEVPIQCLRRSLLLSQERFITSAVALPSQVLRRLTRHK